MGTGRPREPVTLVIATAAFVVHSLVAVMLHTRFESTAYDLGIFEQAIRGYSDLSWPYVLLKGENFNLLGDHFSPILVLVAPFYRVFPTPYTLLVFQSALIALSVVPVGRLAQRHLATPTATLVTIAYAGSWGLQNLSGFDFHEMAFAAPIIAFALERLDARRFRTAAIAICCLLFVKEDLGLTVAVFGYLLWRMGERRTALTVGAVGLGGFAFALLVAIPYFSPSGSYQYVGEAVNGISASSSDPGTVLRSLVNPRNLWTKANLLVRLAIPTAFLALGSTTMLLALPTLAWRLASTNPSHWQYRLQYDAILMPILFVSLIEVLTRLRRTAPEEARRGTRWLRGNQVAAGVVVLVLGAGVTVWGHHAFVDLARPGFLWREGPREASARRAVALIPDGALVEASNELAPHLVRRTRVTLPGTLKSELPQWIAVDMRTRYDALGRIDTGDYVAERLRSGRYAVVFAEDGFEVLRLEPAPDR